MEQHTDGQYDDDLTVGVDDFESDSIETDFVDLFEFSGGDESPISRLKTIMLELDWEITDEVLTQFNEELIDLKDIWSNDPIKIVYVQALEKISKYIYQEKSNSHPSSIKLLLSFYHNLEKVEIDTDLSEEDRQEILQADLKKFAKFKKHIGVSAASPAKEAVAPEKLSSPMAVSEDGALDPSLFNLKACILGMDWEITDRELDDLGKEIKRLQGEFSTNRARMLFLQGIDSLGGYIKLKKSDAHADAFKLLYSFFEGLEKIVVNDLSQDEEKAILLPEVQKFDQFKKLIAPTITPDAIAEQNRMEGEAEFSPETQSSVAPAFAEIEDEEAHGFQLEEEVADLGNGSPDDMLDQLDTFFTDDAEEDESEPAVSASSVAEVLSSEEAMRGVDVETEADDDSDEEALPIEGDGLLAPALSDADEESGFSADSVAAEVAAESEEVSQEEIEDRLSGFFGDDPAETPETPVEASLEDPLASASVDVEIEGDDETDAEPFVSEDGGLLAPALADSDDVSEFSAAATEDEGFETAEISPDEIEDRMTGFFDDLKDGGVDSSAETALEGVNVESDADDDSDEEPLPMEDGGVLAPALSDAGEISEFATEGAEEGEAAESISPDKIEERMAGFFGGDQPEESPEPTEEVALEGMDLETDADAGLIASPLSESDEEPELEPEAELSIESAEAVDEEHLDVPAIDEMVVAEPDAEVEEEFLADTVEELIEADEVEEAVVPDGLTTDDIEGHLSQFLGEEPEEDPDRAEVNAADEQIAADLEETVKPALFEADEITLDEEAAEYEQVLTEALPEDETAEEPADGEELTFETSEDVLEAADTESGSDDEDMFGEIATELLEEQAEELELAVDVADEIAVSLDDDGLTIEAAAEAEISEEVVFAPVDETEAAIPESDKIPVALVDEAESTYTTFDSELDEQDFFAEIDEKVEETGEFKQELLDETEDLETQTLTLPVEQESEELAGFDGMEDMAEQPSSEAADELDLDEFFLASGDTLGDLRTSIASLGVEINDTIIDGVLNDVSSLRQNFMEKPVDKILLELISTIVQHIGQYGYESSAEAHGLLLSAFDKLEQIQNPDTDPIQAQELLLSETTKVLFWQQSMLDRQAIKKGDQLTFMDPLRSDSIGTIEFTDTFSDQSEELEFEPGLELDDETEAAADIDAAVSADHGLELDVAAAEFIKQEMASLKESLRSEIEALRDQLKDRG